MLIPDVTIGFDKAGMLSPDGYCKTFDDSANGYVRSEGIASIILKPLNQALQDGDHIYGVIKSCRINHNGPASGITVPNGVAQAALIEHALQAANVKPEEVDYIEAHGTGTPLGDPIEISAIEKVFKEHRNGNPLLIGSVKSNIGHSEATAGMAGLIKVLLGLKHEAIPASIHFKKPNSKMDLTAISALVPTIYTPWPQQTLKKRIAGVSSFGATGINAHVIVEESPSLTFEEILPVAEQHLLITSAKTEKALHDQIECMINYLQQTQDPITRICYTSQRGRAHYLYQCAVVGQTIEELITKLQGKLFASEQETATYQYPKNVKLRKVQLPTYSFQRNRYWPSILTQARHLQATGKELHPLLGVRLPEIAEELAITFEQIIHPSQQVRELLNDHKIFTQILFPGTGYIELMLAAIRHMEKTEHKITLHHIMIQRPLLLDKDQSVTLQSKIILDKQQRHIALYAKSATSGDNKWYLHAEGDADIDDQLALPSSHQLSLEDLKLGCQQSIDPKEFYEQLALQGLHYGPSFQTLREVYKGDNEFVAKVVLTNTADNRYQMHPALLDGALQALACLLTTDSPQKDIVYLPTSFEKISFYQSVLAESYVHAKLITKTDAAIKANLTFFNETGEILCEIAGFEAKALTQHVFEKIVSPQDTINAWCYKPLWQLYEMPNTDNNTAKNLVTYDARHQPDNKFGTKGLEQLLEFLQAIIRQEEPTHLIIITEQAYSVKNDGITLTQSLFNGFIKTAILEYPTLFIRQLDVTKNQDIEPLLVQLEKDNSRETIFAYRHQQWYVQRIVEADKANHQQNLLSIPSYDYQLIKNADGVLSSLSLIEKSHLLPQNDEIVIEPRAVGLNFRDVLNAMNLYPGDAGPLGSDCAGIVKAVGKNISEYQVGDEVLGLFTDGLSSHARTSKYLVAMKPHHLSFEQAATIPTVFITAYLALVKLAKLQAGETVLIHAASGGVGLAAVQIAKHYKANIIATAGSPVKCDYLHEMGVEQVLDSRSTSYHTDIARLTNGKGVDVVLNSLTGPGFIEASINSLAQKGRFIEIGKRDIWSEQQVHDQRPDVTYFILALDQLAQDHPEEVQVLFQEVMELFAAKALSPIPHTVFPLAKAIDAFKYLQQAKQIGKVVINLPSPQLIFSSQDSYLITGGLGGIGLSVMSYLSEHGAKRIILVSRNQPNAASKAFIEKIQAQGVTVIIKSADVSDKLQVKQLIKEAHCKEFPLKGIFHAAGVIDDAPIDKQTPELLKKVFAAKAQGAWYLHEVTQLLNIKLDYFVLFSSFASLMGSPGQSNYSSANSFLDGLAQYRQQHHLPGLSINWGSWGEVGMAMNLVGEHQRRGIIPLKTKEGLNALDYALHQTTVELGIIHINWQKAGEQMLQSPSWLDNLLDQKQESTLIKQLKETPVHEQEALIKLAISNEIRKVLGLTNQQIINDQQGFFEMGMDSLMALELKNRLQAMLNLPLSNTLIFEYSTIAKITEHLLMQLRSGEKLIMGKSHNILIGIQENKKLIHKAGSLKIAPVSFLQQYWLTRQVFTDIRSGMITTSIEIEGVIDTTIFKLAVARLVERNEVLRTTYSYQIDELKQVIHEKLPYLSKIKKINELDREQVEKIIHQNIKESNSMICDFSNGPLMSITLIDINNASTVVIVSIHHLCTDGISMFLILREINEIYLNLCANINYVPPEKPIQYADFSVWQRVQYMEMNLDKYKKFWKEYLFNAKPLALPYSKTDINPLSSDTGGYIERILNVSEHSVAEFSRNNETTPFVVYFISFLIMASYFSEQEDLLLSVPQSGRNISDVQNLIGFVGSTCLMRSKLSQSMPLKNAIIDLTQNTKKVLEHYLPFDRVRSFDSDLDMGLSYNILFEYIAVDKPPKNIFGHTLKNMFYPVFKFDHDIIWRIEREENNLILVVSYSIHRYTDEDIAKFAKMWRSILENILSNPVDLNIEKIIKLSVKGR